MSEAGKNRLWEDFELRRRRRWRKRLLGNVNTASDHFSTGWKFVILGFPFTRIHLKRTKIYTPSRSMFGVNRAILNGPVWTKCPVKIFSRSKIRAMPCERTLTPFQNSSLFNILCCSTCQMLVNFSGAGFLRTVCNTFKRGIRKLLSCVHVLTKREMR